MEQETSNLTQEKLLQLVNSAGTPETLARHICWLGREYLRVRDVERECSKMRRLLSDAGLAALARLETNQYEWSDGDQRLRARARDVVSIRPTQELADYLRARGCGHLVKVTEVMTLDEPSLFREIRRGTIDLAEVRALADVRVSKGFNIYKLRHDAPAGEEDDAE